MWQSNLLKSNINTMLLEKNWQFQSGSTRFSEVYIDLGHEEIPTAALPKADFAARLKDTHLYIEVDTGDGVSHNSAKYYYILSYLKSKPKKVFVYHILGPGFLNSKHNLIFHRKLAVFLATRIKKAFENEFEFYYEQSNPFLDDKDAVDWLSTKL